MLIRANGVGRCPNRRPPPRRFPASGAGEEFSTQICNGYGEYVTDLYRGLEAERLFT